MARVFVIGAGMAGLAAAVKLAEQSIDVTLCEGAGQAGGRCRSFYDDVLGCRIDNGNHLMLSGNRSVIDFLDLTGARASMVSPSRASFPFLDLQSGERWTVEPGTSPIPLWVFDRLKRVPGTTLAQYGASLKLFAAGSQTSVEQCLGSTGSLYQRFWEPLAVAVLNTPPEQAAAQLLVPVLLETFARGEAACRPLIAREGLSESLVTPALAFIARRHAALRYGERLTGLDLANGRVLGLRFAKHVEQLGRDDAVILALPPAGTAQILPSLAVPLESCAIVNVHYRLEGVPPLIGPPSLLGLVGGTAQWLFRRGSMASVTVSAATALVQEPVEAVAERVWPDVAKAIGVNGPMPPHRVVKERRATFAQTPASLRSRATPQTAYRNLVLAGDWTATGLPATIEGAVRSGFKAASLIAARLGKARSQADYGAASDRHLKLGV